jgi:PAS domain S-box-containing protein
MPSLPNEVLRMDAQSPTEVKSDHGSAAMTTTADYHSLFQTMSRGVIFWDANGNFIEANPAAADILGPALTLIQENRVGEEPAIAIHDDGSPFSVEDLPSRVALRTHLPIMNLIMGVLNSVNKTYTWLSVNAIPQIAAGDVTPTGVYTAFEDITARRYADESLRFLFQATSLLNTSLDYETMNWPGTQACRLRMRCCSTKRRARMPN